MIKRRFMSGGTNICLRLFFVLSSENLRSLVPPPGDLDFGNNHQKLIFILLKFLPAYLHLNRFCHAMLR